MKKHFKEKSSHFASNAVAVSYKMRTKDCSVRLDNVKINTELDKAICTEVGMKTDWRCFKRMGDKVVVKAM